MTLDELITRTRAEASGPGPLDLLASAARRQRALSELGDELLDHFVREARDAGCSWAEIGGVLGVSKQAAQQRHSGVRGLIGKVRSAMAEVTSGMFARFHPQARQAVVQAQEEARGLGHRRIGSEHLLLGVLADPDTPVQAALREAGVDLAALRADLADAAGPSGSPTRGHLPFSGEAKKALELALRQAHNLRHDIIGTEHLLLGLLTDRSCSAAEVLARHGVSLQAMRERFRSAG